MDGSGPRITIVPGLTISPADARLTRLFSEADPWIESGDRDAQRWVSTALDYALDAALKCAGGDHDAVLRCVAIHLINRVASDTLPSEPTPATPATSKVLADMDRAETDDPGMAWFFMQPGDRDWPE